MPQAIKILLLFSLPFFVSCSGCDDETGDPTKPEDIQDVGLDAPDQTGFEDMGFVDMTSDIGGIESDMPADTGSSDMPADMSFGPRALLEFVNVDFVQDPRTQSISLASDGADGWYVAMSSAGRDVVYEPGEPTEVTIDTSGQEGFRSIFAHYDSTGTLMTAVPVSEYAGGPLPGGTSQAHAIAVETSGDVLIAGQFAASVRFGSTVWSTPQATIGGAITTSYETYVIRVSPTTGDVTALLRLASTSAGESNGATTLAMHDNGEFTIAGYFQRAVTLPDGTTLQGRTSGNTAFVARFRTDGTVIYAAALGTTFAYVTDLDGDSVLLRFGYVDSFTLDDTTYSAPPVDHRGYAFVRLAPDGSADWIFRAEATGSPYLHEPTIGSDGNIYVGARLEGAVFPDVVTPVLDDRSLLVIDADNGTVLDAFSTHIVPEDYLELAHYIFDEVGILWVYTGYSFESEVTVTPTFGPSFVLSPDDPQLDSDGHSLLLGYDVSDGSLAYAHFSVTQGYASPDDILLLSSGEILVAAHYFYDEIVEPLSESPIAITNDVQGRNPDAMFLRYR